MVRNGFWTGLITGSILGITLVLLRSQTNEKAAVKNSDLDYSGENYSEPKSDKSSAEEAVDRLNFSKKIRELEEALDQIREQ